MKKIIIGVLALVMSTSLFAKSWTSNVGVGFTVPITMVQGKDNIFIESLTSSTDKKTFTTYGLQGMYLGYHDNGFTFKGKLDLAFGMDKKTYYDYTDKEFKDILAINLNETLGVGYSFIRSEKVLLAATAGIGLSQIIIPYKTGVKYNGTSTDQETTITYTTFNLGADLTAILRTSQKFGFYASFYIGWIPFGNAKTENKIETTSGGTTNSNTTTNTKDLNGNIFIAPTIGLVWTF